MLSKNKLGFTIRNSIIYVQGSINGEFKKYSTNKKTTKINIAWIKRNAFLELKRIYKQKNVKIEVSTKFVDYTNLSFELRKNRLKQNTYKEYKDIFENCVKPFFQTYDIKDISRIDLRKWQNDFANSGKTVNNYRSVFNIILEDARKDGLIDKKSRYKPI